MKHVTKTLALLFLGGMALTSCKKDVKTSPDEISQDVLTKIHDMGFGNTNVQKIEEGYLVEGDIILTQNDFNSTTPVTAIRVANTEQYRTTNLVTSLPRNITVSVSNRLPSSYYACLTEMVRRYNAENLQITFTQVSSGGQIDFVPAHGQYLASSGFPDAQGNPYPTVKVNAQYLGSGNGSQTFINYIATIFAHEVGHCIGFRHTDYMDRSYSCGGGYSNEGASSVGAINIPGTPTTAEPNSFMLACISANQNRPFDNYDKTALNYLY